MLESTEREIDGTNYQYMPLMATPARELLDKLIQRFGPAVGKTIKALDQANGLSLDHDTKDTSSMLGALAAPLGEGISELADKLDPKFHADLVKTLAKQTCIEVDGNWPQLAPRIEQHFAVNLMSEAKWIKFCLECQYSDFLGLFQGGAISLMALKAKANGSGSQKGSTGGSTE